MTHFDYFGELIKQNERSAALLTSRDGAGVLEVYNSELLQYLKEQR